MGFKYLPSNREQAYCTIMEIAEHESDPVKKEQLEFALIHLAVEFDLLKTGSTFLAHQVYAFYPRYEFCGEYVIEMTDFRGNIVCYRLPKYKRRNSDT